MNMFKRLLSHLLHPFWWVRHCMTRKGLDDIAAAIKQAETGNRGEIAVAIEPALGVLSLLKNQTARDRALEVFSLKRLWDTQENNGVLIYVLLADRAVEIVADRGFSNCVSQEWFQNVTSEMEASFANRDYHGGVIRGVRHLGQILTQQFPGEDLHGDELPNQPFVL